MTVFQELKEASYRGIRFFYQSASETGGFKVAEHLYPGSDNFKVEQLGKVPKRFDVECRIEKSNRDAFDTALNTPGSGIFSHPLYGNFIVKVTQYTKTDSINELGFYNYSVQFVVELGLIIPSTTVIGLSVINKARSALVERAGIFIKDKLKGLGL